MEQVRKTRQSTTTKTVEEIPEEVVPETEQPDLTLTDELLDEIDSILEENAQEFVRDYIQKGGE